MKTHKQNIAAEPGKLDMIITREFDAPRELVFKAHTDPKHLERWLGPRELTLKIEKLEPKNGGAYRYIHTDKKGTQFSFHGVFHEVRSPERLIKTFEYEGNSKTGHVSLETTNFESLPGDQTRVTTQAVFQSVADRDGMMQAEMERGLSESYERLDELLEKELVR